MGRWARRFIIGLVVLLCLGGLAWAVTARLAAQAQEPEKPQRGPVPVELAAVEHGPIQWRRTFSGTLEAPAAFVVAPKVSGRIVRLAVDLADTVERDQVVAELDSDEYQQAVAQAEAELAVAQASLSEARSSLEITRRELQRIETLRERGIASDSQLDAVKSDELAKSAAAEVAAAQVARAQAALRGAQIRLGYAEVRATWRGGDDQRVVAERHVDEGDTVAANTPLLSIVELDPINAVFFVTERDYAQLAPGQPVTLSTDAYPGERFAGEVTRVAPVFRQGSRQARVELRAINPERRLKPGMFVRIEAVLDRVEDATIVPVEALATRDDRTILFVVSGDGATVSMRPVEVGIRDGKRVQVTGEAVEGQVVTLGQQLLDDGSAITVPQHEHGAAGGGRGEAEAAGS